MKTIYYSLLIISSGMLFSCADNDDVTQSPEQPVVSKPPVAPDPPSEPEELDLKLSDDFQSGSEFNSSVTQAPPVEAAWEIVANLTDEFDADKVDEEKWFDYHPFWKGRLPSQFKKGNTFLDGSGVLKLRSTLHKDPNSVPDNFAKNNNVENHWVDAAALVSKTKTAVHGYYYETSFKASNLSMTSSYWFRVGQFSEIDVIEHIGNPSRDNRDADLPFQYHVNTHYYGKHAGLPNLAKEYKMKDRGRDRFHVYGFWWKSPTELIFYHDGKQVMELTPRVPLDENLHMIFDTEVFPFATAGVANIGLPLPENLNDNTKNTMEVDYVRVYKKATNTVDSGLLENGSFENGRLHEWSYKGKVDVLAKTTESTVNDAVLSIQLSDKGAIGQNISVEKDQKYRITFFAKGKGEMYVLDQEKEQIDTTEWKEFTYDFSYDKNGNSALLIEALVSEKLVVDNFKMVKI